MTITVLATPIYNRRYVTMYRDNAGRIFAYQPIFINANVDYDRTVTGAPAERYDPASNSWTALPFSSEAAQSNLASWWIGDQFSRLGGQYVGLSVGGDETYAHSLGTLEIYDTASNTWSFGGSLPLGQQRTFVVAWLEGGITPYIAGGLGFSGSVGGNTVTGQEVYKYVAGVWTRVADAPRAYQLRDEPPVDSVGRRYFTYFSGGRVGIDRYTPVTDTWESLPTLSTLAGLTITGDPTDFVIVNDILYAFAGVGSASVAWMSYTIATDTWTRLADRVSPATGRLIYHAVTNTLVLPGGIWIDPATSHRTGIGNIYQYDIASDQWTDTGDVLSEFRTFLNRNSIVYDGVGIYLGPGQTQTPPSPVDVVAANVFEYWSTVLPVTTRARSYAQIIG